MIKTQHAEKDKFTQFVDVRQVNAALFYLDIEKKEKKRAKYLCLGRDAKTREFLSKLVLPPIPLLADNVDLRNSLKPREKSPLYRVLAAACVYKFKSVKEEIKTALKDQTNQQTYPVLYRLEPPKDGEPSNEPLTWEEYQALLKD